MVNPVIPQSNEVAIQRGYYAKTAQSYDGLHLQGQADLEHRFALTFLIAVLDYLGIQSILDLGSGTGRVILEVMKARPDIRVLGIEPSAELREVGYSKGLLPSQLMGGDATTLPFRDASFDLVCEFAVLHHIRSPQRAISEMLRVSRKAIFISDANNFGKGRGLSRFLKQALNASGLWPVANYLKTRGKGYHISEGDGLAYSYSVFNNYRQIRNACQSVHLFNTVDAGPNIYRTAPHVALLGIKTPPSNGKVSVG